MSLRNMKMFTNVNLKNKTKKLELKNLIETTPRALDNENHRPGPKSRRTKRKKSRYKPMPKSELAKRMAQNSPQFQINFSNKCSESFDGFETNDNHQLGGSIQDLKNDFVQNIDSSEDIQVNFAENSTEKISNLPDIKLEVLVENGLGLNKQPIGDEVKTEVTGLLHFLIYIFDHLRMKLSCSRSKNLLVQKFVHFEVLCNMGALNAHNIGEIMKKFMKIVKLYKLLF